MQPCTISDKLYISSVEGTSTIFYEYFSNISTLFPRFLSFWTLWLTDIHGSWIYTHFAKCSLKFLQWDFKTHMFKPVICILFILLLILWPWYLRNILEKFESVFNLQCQPSWNTLLWTGKHRDLLKTFSFPGLGNRDMIVTDGGFLTQSLFLHKCLCDRDFWKPRKTY